MDLLEELRLEKELRVVSKSYIFSISDNPHFANLLSFDVRKIS